MPKKQPKPMPIKSQPQKIDYNEYQASKKRKAVADRIRSFDGCLLNLQQARVRSESKYDFCEGLVKNISGKTLNNVVAVVTFFGVNGKYLQSESAMLTYKNLAPGQTSPFKVIARNRYRVTKADVEFKTIRGEYLKSCQ
ncbi:MAG: hypothetical protein HUN05_18545 [Desulfobacter sp.]|nr:MAG: hypothetical protein HUN05_18545 [Desulfobacter sp.]